MRIKTDLTKILNPLTKPKSKTQHSFRLHEDLKHQSFPSSTKTTRKCYESSLKNRRGTYVITIQAGELGWIAEADVINEKRPGPTGEVQEREINGKKFKLNTSLCKELEEKIVDMISKNMNAFAWSSANMPGIDPYFLCHWLTIDEKVKLVVHRQRIFNEDKRLIIRKETQKLLDVGHEREIQYPERLANVVLVHKTNGK